MKNGPFARLELPTVRQLNVNLILSIGKEFFLTVTPCFVKIKDYNPHVAPLG